MEDVTVNTRGAMNATASDPGAASSSWESTPRREGPGLGSRQYPETINLDSRKEFETIKERGLYKAPGTELPEETEIERPVHVIKENSPVVEELVYTKQVHEIVPQVYREHEMSEIRHAVLPLHERYTEGVTHSEAHLEEIRSPDLRSEMSLEEQEKNRRIREEFSRTRSEQLPTEHQYRYHAPIVYKVVKPRIIHEIHPVITREVDREHVRREILPVYERIIDGPRVSDEIDMLKSMSKDEWERERISGRIPEERYASLGYQTPPRSPMREGARAYTSPERVRPAETRPAETERAYYGSGYKVLDPGYSTRMHPGELSSPISRRETFVQRASHLVHPVGHEADRLHRMSPVGGFRKEAGLSSHLQTPTASPR